MKTEAELWTELRKISKRMKVNPFESREDTERMAALLWTLDFPLVPVRVDGEGLTIKMGQIRDTGRESFSHDHEPFDEAKQRKFWRANKDTMTAYIFKRPESYETVGYAAVILREDGKYYTSNAILPEWRGKGYGKAVLHFIVNIVDHDCWASALLTNKAAWREHNIADWEQVKVDEIGGLVHFHTWRGRK